jgi:hypothetical protein
MRKLYLASTVISLSAAIGWACSGDTQPTQPPADAGSDVVDATQDNGTTPDPDSGPTSHCTLDTGVDPVAFCIQKTVLDAEVLSAYAKGLGVVSSWDSTSYQADKDDAGKPLHDLHNDLWFTSSIANFHVSAGTYGDNTLSPKLDDILAEVEPVLEAELGTAPDGYDGETYAHLRNTAAGLRYINESAKAAAIDKVADAYGRQIYTKYVHALPASDAGAPDAVIGASDGHGNWAYVTADAATGALALLDMVARHGGDAGDDAANAALWDTAARAVLDHLYNRARHTSGMYYRALVTSADPQHDALAPSPQGNDVLLSDVQATVALTLSRASALVTDPKKGGMLSSATQAYPFNLYSSELLDALNGSLSLWDQSADAGTPNADAGVAAGYIEGVVPATSTLLRNRSTRANALLLGAVHRHIIDDSGKQGWQGKWLRAELIKELPVGSSLLAVVQNQSGYLRASSFDYGLAVLSADGGDGGLVPLARSYDAASIGAALEALNELWYGWQH